MMQTEEKLIPVLRFPEFEGAWNEQTLADLLTFKNGLNASKENYGSGYKFINVLDIIQNDFITHEAIIGSVDVSSEEFEKYLVEYGDILFQRSSETREEVGQANVYLDRATPATFGGFVIRGKPRVNYDPAFMNYLLKTSRSRNEITSKSGGSTRYNVGQDTLSKVSILTTSLDEQQKIASFLTAVDERIRLLQRKKAKLEEYKKGVMQRLFADPLSESGLSGLEDEQDREAENPLILASSKSSFRQLRFQDENGHDFPAWEEKKLGEIGSFIGGGTPESSSLEYWSGTIPWISSSDIREETIQKVDITRFITQEAVDNSATKIVPKDSILIVSRVGIGKFAVAPQDLCTSQDFTSFVTEENSYFLAYYFRAKANYFVRLSQGTSIKGFTGKDLRNLRFPMPTILLEQQKIATFLSSIDAAIEKVGQQIDASGAFKKGLLQKMFV